MRITNKHVAVFKEAFHKAHEGFASYDEAIRKALEAVLASVVEESTPNDKT